jgi:hypothetical protein
MAPEFSRLLQVERIPAAGTEEVIEASPEEREALARRFDVPAILSLVARVKAVPWRRGGVEVRGEVEAEVEQVSVVSLESFTSRVSEPLVRYFQAENAPGHRPGVLSVESLEDEPDVISAGAIDLGELAAETLALALDPYPRKPGEVFAQKGEDTAEDRPESPFGVLSRLKRP